MRTKLISTRRAVAVCLCAALLLPFFTLRVAADDGPKVIIEIGQPSIWSLGQAHYLLAKMHRRDRKLSTRFPDDNDLDSNRISATRIDALRQSIGIEGQFDQAMGTQNNLALRRFREGEVRRETARADLIARQGELQKVNTDLADINEQIAVLTEQDRQSKEERDRATPPTPPTAADNERKLELARLGVRKTRKEEERTELKSQITSLTTTADTPTAAPTLQEPALTTDNGSLPNPATFQKFMDKALAEAGKPELSASMKLDNFVNMQYEIISKQLTLLRDEVGPDDRVIFLELPASIYTVDKKADNYIAQTDWEVVNYYDREPSEEVQGEVIVETLKNEGKKESEIRATLLHISNVRSFAKEYEAWARLRENAEAQKQLRSIEAELSRANTPKDKIKETLSAKEATLFQTFLKQVQEEVDEKKYGSPRPYPITLEMIRRAAQKDDGAAGKAAVQLAFGKDNEPCPGQIRQEERDNGNHPPDPCKYNVRAIDIIPRQSALNVNEYHATVKQTMILAAFKFLIGFAGKVNFQRQRELYEQFVQQEVFASGYGKGGNKFGWTYGPQPGTKRIKTGQRTTFAVLVVPRNTLAIELNGRGRFFKRNESPVDNADDVKASGEANYLLSVPGEKTQEFWVDSISYTPVKKGKRVTAIIEGEFFSPQLGLMVNGVPLEPVVSISRTAGSDEETDVLQSADGVAGEYEITNSRQIILSFTMGDSYVGTPSITFTSPEKTTSINFFDLDINHRGVFTSLQEQSVREPMFIEDFNDKMEIEVVKQVPVVDANGDPADAKGARVANKDDQAKFKLVRIKGAGMRPGAEITLNDGVIGDRSNFASLSAVLKYVDGKPTPLEPFVAQDSTKSYLLYFPDPKNEKWKVGYRHLTRQGYEEGSAEKSFATPAFATAVRNYRFDPASRRGEVDLTFTSEKVISRVFMDDLPGGTCRGPKPGGEKQYRVKCFVPASNGGKLERDFFTVKVTLVDASGNETDRYEDIRLTVRPMVTSVVNPRTGYAAGFADEEPTVIITGVNLQGIKSVLFGDKEAKVAGTASPDAIAVKVPKGAAVPRGQAVAVPIIFQTNGGQVPSGAVYTYLGEPLPPNVIVWPPPVSGKP